MYLIFDIGGTKTRIALTDNKDIVGDAVIYETPKDYEAGCEMFINNAKKLTTEKIDGVTGGIAGILDSSKSNLVNIPNLPNWNEKPFKQKIESTFGCPVKMENDAALAALGEAVFGAGKNANIVSYLTFGTGVGGARIVNKHIDNNLYGFEPGHHIVDINQGLMNKDCDLEYFSSGSGIIKRMSQKPQDITDQKIWDKVMDFMSVGIANALCFWPCDVFVIGGGLTRHPLTNMHHIQSKVVSILNIYSETPAIVRSELGELSCLYGAISHQNM